MSKVQCNLLDTNYVKRCQFCAAKRKEKDEIESVNGRKLEEMSLQYDPVTLKGCGFCLAT